MRIVRNNTKKLFLYTGLFGITLSALSVGLGAYFSTQTAYAYSADAFVMEIDTTILSESNTTFVIPTLGTGYDYTVDCDDAGPMAPVSNQTGDYSCEYDIPGVYTIAITGDFPQVQFASNSNINALHLLDIKQWGSQQWRSMENAFISAANMQITAPDTPNLSNVTDMSQMFAEATNFNSDISAWDVSNVTDMSRIFAGARNFNSDISAWDVSSVTNMSGMFIGAINFNSDVSAWDVSSVTNMSEMFFAAYSLNSDISAWDVSSVTNMLQMFAEAHSFNSDISGWDVSSVTNMSGMFYSARSFNSDISGWDVSNVTNMQSMFYYAINFNVDISSWDVSNVTDMYRMFYMTHNFNSDISAWDVSNVTNMQSMFNMTNMSRDNYQKLLLGWSQQPLQSNVFFGAQDLKYCTQAAADARQSIISNYNWTIDGDRESCTVPVVASVEFTHEDSKSIMEVLGTGFFEDEEDIMTSLYPALYGASLVSINGQSLKWCTEGTGFTEASLLEQVGLTAASDTAPCYYLIDSEINPIVTPTQFRIWLPDTFDITAPGTVVINKSPVFTFNADATPTPTATTQPLAPVSTTVPVAAALRTATLQVSGGECASIDALQTRLLAADTVAAPSGMTVLGGVGFELECETPGGSTQVSLRLGQQYSDLSILSAYKDLAGDGTLTPVDVTFVNRNGATYVEFPLTDGLTDAPTGLIDEDGVEDGRIVDPLYIAVQTSATSPQDGEVDSPVTSDMAGAGTILPGAPNSGFGSIAAVTSKVAASIWGVVMSVVMVAVVVTGVMGWRRAS